MRHSLSEASRAPRAVVLAVVLAALLALLALLALFAGAAGALPIGERHFLGNGIEVLLLPDATSRVATSIVVLGSGSSWESARTCGASHFLEHMLFNGTAARTQEQLYAETDFYGAFNNATTRRTHVAFMLTVPERFFGRGLDLQADMLLGSTLPPEKFEKERGIILEELLKDRESGRYELDRLLDAETYPRSSYGLPVLGTPASIEKLTREEVLEFYRRNYVPERMQILLLGGFDPRAALDSLEATFGEARPAGAWSAPPAAPQPILAARAVHHARPLERARLRCVWNAPAPEDPGFLAAEAAAALALGDGASPLAQRVAERVPGAIADWSGRIEAGPGFGRLIIDIDVDEAAGGALEEIAGALIEAAAAIDPIDPAALAAWQSAQRASLVFARQRAYMFAPLYAEVVALQGAWGLQTLIDQTAALTAAEVSRAAGSLGQGPCLSILVAATPLPAAAPSGMPGMAGMPPAPAAAPSGMPGMPSASAMPALQGSTASSAAAPAARRGSLLEPPPYGVTDTLLANGARAILLATPPSGVLAVYLLIEGRNYLEPAGLHGITELLHLLMGSATAARDEAAFARELQAIGAELQTADQAALPFDDRYTRRDFSFVRFQCLEEHAGRAFALLGEMLARPSLDPALIERRRGQLLARLHREAGQGRTLAEAEMGRLLHGADHPAARSPYGDTLGVAAISPADLSAYHRRLLDPRRIQVGVASSLPAADILAALSWMLPPSPALPSPTLGFEPGAFAAWNGRTASPPGLAPQRWSAISGSHELVGDGQRGYVLEAIPLPAELTRDAAAARIAVGFLTSRLGLDLRETRGLAYGIGARLERLGDRWLCISAAATRAPQVEAMEAGFGEVRRALPGAAGAEALQREAHALYGSELRRQESRLNQAMEAVWSARAQGDPLAWWNETAAVLEAPPPQVMQVLAVLAAADSAAAALRVVVR